MSKFDSWRKVSKEEFWEFLKNYPRELERHTVAICEPPIRQYHDFALGEPKDGGSLVAAITLNEDMGEPTPIPNQHLIAERR